MATSLWASPSYSAAGVYHPAFLAGGFLLGRRAGKVDAPLVYATAAAFAACLSFWSLWQQLGGEARSHALFETPATLAAYINFALLPGLVLLATQRVRSIVVSLLTLLVAALLATLSRGGWLAFALSMVVSFVFLHHGRVAIAARGYLAAAGVLIGGALLLLAIAAVRQWADVSAESYSVVGVGAVRSASERFALYQVALQAISTSSPWLGSGYLAFYYFVEAATPAVRSYTSTPFYFVHNDYLQVLLELGVPGLVALLALVVLPLGKVWRSLGQTGPEDRPVIVAIVAATTAMAAHAVVDFPFYVPVCLLPYGIALGLLESLAPRTMPAASGPSPILGRAAIAAMATVMTFWLIKPAVADACSLRASEQWRSGHGENAAFWFELARRIEPRDWRYHWYAGQFWFALAQANRSAPAAERADAAFAAGTDANPRDVHNLLGRLATQRRLRELLAEPLEEEALAELVKRATSLAPHDPAVHLAIRSLSPKAKQGSE